MLGVSISLTFIWLLLLYIGHELFQMRQYLAKLSSNDYSLRNQLKDVLNDPYFERFEKVLRGDLFNKWFSKIHEQLSAMRDAMSDYWERDFRKPRTEEWLTRSIDAIGKGGLSDLEIFQQYHEAERGAYILKSKREWFKMTRSKMDDARLSQYIPHDDDEENIKFDLDGNEIPKKATTTAKDKDDFNEEGFNENDNEQEDAIK